MWSYERGGGGDGARRNVNLCKLITTAAAIATTVLARGKPILTECERGRDGGDREREYKRVEEQAAISVQCRSGALNHAYLRHFKTLLCFSCHILWKLLKIGRPKKDSVRRLALG